MLWVNDLKKKKKFSLGRTLDASILTSKDGPRAEMVNILQGCKLALAR